MTDKTTTETHESFGLIGVSRFTCNPPLVMFGSSIRHHAGVAIEIHRAEKQRSLAGDHFFATQCLIRLELSPAQFADFITSANIGDGVPCTLTRVMNKGMARCPETNERATIVQEFRDQMLELGNQLEGLITKARELQAKPSINKGDREQFVKLAETIQCQVANSLPFIHSQFNEAMDGVLSEAKADLDGWVGSMLRKMGTDALQQKLLENAPQLPAPPELPDVPSKTK
jgi:hypothetical protein